VISPVAGRIDHEAVSVASYSGQEKALSSEEWSAESDRIGYYACQRSPLSGS